MSRRKICASIQVLLCVSLLLLCALCSAETVANEIDAPISSVRRLLGGTLTVYIDKGHGEKIAVDVPAAGTVRDLKIATNLLPSQHLMLGGVELTDDDISLAEAEIGTEAALYIEDHSEYVELTFLVKNTEILRSILLSISESDSERVPVTLKLALNRPIFDEIRNQLAQRYRAVDDYSPTILLSGSTGEYSDVQLVRVKDFEDDGKLTMLDFGYSSSNLQSKLTSGEVPKETLLIFLLSYRDIQPNFAFVYKNRENRAWETTKFCWLKHDGARLD